MNLDRRAFLALSTLTAAGLALPSRPALAAARLRTPSRTADTHFEWKKVAEGCHVAIGEGGNSLAMIAGGETLIVDAKHGGYGATLRREAAALGSPVKMLINTHHHGDHIGGNPAFTKDLRVLAHANAVERIPTQHDRIMKSAAAFIAQLKQSPKPAAKEALADIEAFLASSPTAQNFLPNETIPSSGTISFGGEDIELYHVGPGHTDNDLLVFFPQRNVLHAGDTLFNTMWPYFDPNKSGADSAGWIRTCEKITELCNDKTIVIPGHGDVGNAEIAKRQIEFFKHMRDTASKAIADGATREDFTKLRPEQYKDYNAADSIGPLTLGGLWDEAKKASGK